MGHNSLSHGSTGHNSIPGHFTAHVGSLRKDPTSNLLYFGYTFGTASGSLIEPMVRHVRPGRAVAVAHYSYGLYSYGLQVVLLVTLAVAHYSTEPPQSSIMIVLCVGMMLANLVLPLWTHV